MNGNSDSQGRSAGDLGAGGLRPLDEEERAEVARLARRVRTKPVWIAVPLTLWFWPVFFLSVAARRFPQDWFGLFSFALLGGVTIFWEWQVVAGIGLSKRLNQDLLDGTVVVEESGVREVLPISRMEWTVDSLPAPWRGYPPPIPDETPPKP